jgi:enamine deaminase RidA (YjgF/YER057c/UK114 family)
MKTRKKESEISRRKLLTASVQTAAVAASASALSNAQTAPRTTKGKKPSARFLNPDGLSKPRGYTHVVEVTSGHPVYISGQIAVDKDGNIVGKGDFRAQAVQVFENLKIALAAVGADFSHVVKLNNYLLDIGNIDTFREVRNQYINAENPPASTLVEVLRLARPDLQVEIEVIAIVPPK